jgi:hypothetical protein
MQSFIYRILILAVVVSLLLAGCNLVTVPQASSTGAPSETPADPTQTATVSQEPRQPTAGEAVTQPAGTLFTYAGISLRLAPELATGARVESLPENLGTPGGPYWDALPQYVRISLDGYPLTQKFFEPEISIYPVEDYRRVSPQAGPQLDRLQGVLDQQPSSADQYPFLPVFNAGQVFDSDVAYLEFQNGRGVRYLTIYAQYAAPVNNYDLFYTFQGLTDDGKTFISAILPVNHPSLPADPNALSSAEMDNIIKNYDLYIADQATALSSQPAGSFTPGLDQLDALIRSLEIGS